MCAVTALTLVSCSSTHPSAQPLGETTRTTIYKEGVPGGIIIETTQLRATVVAVDTTNRAVTVAVPDGRQKVIGCGPEVANFDQIRVGDQVNAVVKSELVLALPGSEIPSVDASISAAVLAPKGDKPGGVVSQMQEYTATVTAINQRRREVTLRLPDHTKRTFPVRPDVDLSQRKVGQQVAVRVTVAVAISVEAPGAGSK
jgi:hypothetical protein